MLIKKQYEFIVNLNSLELYAADLNIVILDKLRKTFEGRCYKSSLISKILRIIRRSFVRPAQNHTDGSGSVNVVFEAEAVIYNEHDIITNCVVKNVERSGELICKIDHAAIHIRGNVILRGIQIGQTIPIRVVAVRYSKGKDNITINATPYFHAMSFMLYRTDINAKNTQESFEIISDLIKAAEDEKAAFDKLDEKIRDFFTDVFYPFTDKPKREKVAKLESVDMLTDAKRFIKSDSSKEAPMLVMRHPRTEKSEPEIYHIDESIFKDATKISLLDMKQYEIKVEKESYAQILINYIEEYINYLKMIQELVATFDTEDKRQQHKNIWAIYNRLKK